MGYFKLYQSSKNAQYYFTLKAANHEPILQSEGYTSKSAAQNGIDSVKANAPSDSRYERKEAKNGQFYFNLKATNGQTIGTSEMYVTKSGMENGIESVKTNAPKADVKE